VVKLDDVDAVVVKSGVPPAEAEYQRNVPVTPDDAPNATAPGLQIPAGVTDTVTDDEIVAVTGTRVVGPQTGDADVKLT